MTSAASNIVEELAAPASASQGDILEFPTTGQIRTQDVILRGIMAGQSFEELAGITNLPVDKVRLIAKSNWVKKELSLQNASESSDTVRNLLRVYAFDAIQRVHEIASQSKCEKTALAASRTILEFSIAPAKALDIGRGKRTSANATPDEMKAEIKALEDEIKRRQTQPQTI